MVVLISTGLQVPNGSCELRTGLTAGLTGLTGLTGLSGLTGPGFITSLILFGLKYPGPIFSKTKLIQKSIHSILISL